jgi:hypothetical protein
MKLWAMVVQTTTEHVSDRGATSKCVLHDERVISATSSVFFAVNSYIIPLQKVRHKVSTSNKYCVDAGDKRCFMPELLALDAGCSCFQPTAER